MRVVPRGLPYCLAAVLFAAACGGGGSTGTPPPPPPPPPTPANLTKQPNTDNQTANVGQTVAIAPAVKVTSATGAAISGVAVTFAVASGGGSVTGANQTTGIDGVATVGSWSLGPSAGTNTLTATISGSGITGNPATFTATGQLAAFNPTQNAIIGGTLNFSSVNIPVGVTVTVATDLLLNATGAITIAGTLIGDCKNLTVSADGALTVTGTINNACSGGISGTGAPVITLVGKGGYSFTGANTVAAGDVTITDDPTATDADFAPSPFAPALRTGMPPQAVGVPCNVASFTGVPPAGPPDQRTAPNGADGNPNGANGKDAGTWTLRCKGGGDIIVGTLSLTGQHGGKGGNGTHSHATAAVSRGGNGGKGGTVKIQSVGSIVIGGGTITTGNGGAGGSSQADGTGGGGNVGASADATGGNGAEPGLFTAKSKNGGISITGALTLNIGGGGLGGDAIANGADGHHAEPCPPAAGGPATATGGDGGSTPDKQLTASGAVSGLGNLTVTGGAPGKGGDATAKSGKGGNGAKACKPGAVGGDPTAKGGKGGDANVRNQAGVKIANGGNGGKMEDRDGKGGHGWIDCVVPFEPGGNGGMGGSSKGFNGTAGSGFSAGSYGAAIFNVVSNGGDGGDGQGPGAGGPAGANNALLVNVSATIIAPSFQPGNPGAACAASVDLTAQNGEQATRPWTKFLTRIGAAAWQSHTISPSGSVTFPVPTAATQMSLALQQQVGNDRRTFVYYMRSDDVLAIGGAGFSEDAKGSITTQVSGVPANSYGVSYAGPISKLWTQPNTSPFNVSLDRVPTGFNVVGGCAYSPNGLDPQSAILGLQTYANGGNYGCNFGGPGVVSFVGTPFGVDGQPPGTSLNLSGGVVLGLRHTQFYSKTFLTPSTTYYTLPAAALPSGVYGWEAVSRQTSTNLEQSTFYYTSPLNVTTTLSPQLNEPTVNITSIFNTYYVFQILLASQPQYQGAWTADYTQANTFGGTNEVILTALPHYFGTSVPSTIDWSTPADNLFDSAYMPKPPGLVNGNILGYGFNPFLAPQPPNVRVIGVRLNYAF